MSKFQLFPSPTLAGNNNRTLIMDGGIRMQVRDIMTKNPACAMPSDSLQSVAQKMIDCNCGLLPVVDSSMDNKLIGVITDRDIVCRVVAKGANCGVATVQDAMTTEKLWLVKPDDTVDTVIDDMEKGHIRRVPVVDDNRKVLGVVALADIAKTVDVGDKVAEVIIEVSQPTNIPRA